jgi:hypothetical protein
MWLSGPVTFQVVGHAKTCLILIGGFVLFPAALSMKNVVGIVLALAGVIIYGEVKMKADQTPRGADFYDHYCPGFVSRALDDDGAASATAAGYAPVSISMSPVNSSSSMAKTNPSPVAVRTPNAAAAAVSAASSSPKTGAGMV